MATKKKTPELVQSLSDLDTRLEQLRKEGMEEGKDYVIQEYSHGYIDVKMRHSKGVWEFRPNGTEIVRDIYGKELQLS